MSNDSFVDRDMVMRYHFGHGVGHVYSHGSMPDYLRKRQDTSSSHENGSLGIANGSSAANLDATEPHHTSSPPADGPDSSIDDDSDFEDSEPDSEASLSDPSGDESDSESGDHLDMSGTLILGTLSWKNWRLKRCIMTTRSPPPGVKDSGSGAESDIG